MTAAATTKLLAGSLAGLGLFGLAALGPSLLGDNFRAVVPGRVYRSGQLSPENLEERVLRHGIQSIVNLRGEKENRDWYRRELEVAERHEVGFRSIDLVPERLPSQPDVVALIDSLESLSQPILIHCSAGSDRTGFASVIARMALDGAAFEDARSELSLWYGHFPIGPASEIARFFDRYEAYRRESGAGSDWASFEHWARELYVPYAYKAAIEAVGLPSEAAVEERMDVRVRVRNESREAWILTSDRKRGVKLGVKLLGPESVGWLDYDRHGHIDRTIRPGETLELDAVVWAPKSPGDYEMKLDMVDEHVTWFEDQGSEPLVWKINVRRQP